ncbi:SHOCT domain-containing protein [Weissella coleopterorum]|uniref:SHOCT domain-containing protein n=2 Tax=Weissella coleopterorum TaxID=2714949 RepID=A0A6G8B276_9LACO|nr:SHOCT domain-containing protein [Weissella coleopterorum]
MVFAEIRIDNGMKTTEIVNVNKHFAPIFVKKLKEVTSNNIKSVSESSIADELLKYKELLESGLLTQYEFDEQKQKLLNK